MTTLNTLAVQAIEATVKAHTTKELVTLWNSRHIDSPIKKFADRATAEKRCIAMLIAAAEAEPVVEEAAAPIVDVPKGAVHKARRVEAKSEEPVKNDEEQTEEEALAEIRAMAAAAAAKKFAPSKASGMTLSAAIEQSWKDPVVADKRKQRNGVLVEANGKTNEFKSVRTAFAELNLPDEKHIRFRLKLKEHKVAVFEYEGASYKFTLTETAAKVGE